MVESLFQTEDSGSNPTPSLHYPSPDRDYAIQQISTQEMSNFTAKWHYSKSMPRLTKICYGGFREGKLVAAISFGWGSRPLHTIRKLFPGLTTKDYFEIGRMCLEDDEPKNSETKFMSLVFRQLKKDFPGLKLIFTWSDGMWGKPGYVYQAGNFLYGGYIWTDAYLDEKGQKLHPFQLQGEWRRRGLVIEGRSKRRRPTLEEMNSLGWKHYYGKQFRYILFLCGKRERGNLLSTSTVEWGLNHPKDKDCEWKVTIDRGKKVFCESPMFKKSVNFHETEGSNANPSK